MAIQLIGYPISTCTLRVIATLKELGVSYEITPPSDFSELKTPEYLATKHPFGKIPVLIDDGFKIYESRAIIRYLVNKYQGKKNSTILIPTDVQKAGLVEQFISVESSYYDEAVHKLVAQEVFTKFHGKTPDPEIVKEARVEIGKVLDVYEKLLEGKDYLTGEFSLADISHYPYTYYSISSGHGDLWEKRPNVARWWKNISEREVWKGIVAELNQK
ncbi:putative glutathione S-transferase [Rhizophagus diaphanus]|nr:putative glutathione S-transferase [Rhizophagus diaphanus] [Rhizophagus sp. MUCL 43196]